MPFCGIFASEKLDDILAKFQDKTLTEDIIVGYK